MKKILILALLVSALVSCGPTKHAIHVEMRHPSKAGVELAGKNVSVVYLENDDAVATGFNESMAGGFAYALEQDYGPAAGEIGVYKMKQTEGADLASKDSLFNVLMDTGADVVFLFDVVKFGNMTVGGPSKVSYKTSPDSSYVNSCSIPFTMKLYCYDAMNREDKVQKFGGTSLARPSVYSNGKDDSTISTAKAYKALAAEGWEAGKEVAESFKSQWKHEQYSVLYYESSEKWLRAMQFADNYDWRGAMDIWLTLLDSTDVLKQACAAYNLATACYMLGDYHLALEWLDLSDSTSKLPISDALRKRISSTSSRT